MGKSTCRIYDDVDGMRGLNSFVCVRDKSGILSVRPSSSWRAERYSGDPAPTFRIQLCLQNDNIVRSGGVGEHPRNSKTAVFGCVDYSAILQYLSFSVFKSFHLPSFKHSHNSFSLPNSQSSQAHQKNRPQHDEQQTNHFYRLPTHPKRITCLIGKSFSNRSRASLYFTFS